MRPLIGAVMRGAVGNIHRCLGNGNRCLVGLNGALDLRNGGILQIQLLAWNQPLIQQSLISCGFKFCVLKRCLVLRQVAARLCLLSFCLGQLPLRLSQLVFERTLIDFRQKIALFDELAFLVNHIYQLSIDT